MLANKTSASKLAIQRSLFGVKIALTKVKESLTVDSFCVISERIMAKIFLSHHEENWLNKYPIWCKPSFYRSYVDDIFVFFESPESVHSLCEYMSSKHKDINFNVEHWFTFVFRRQNLS